MTRVARAMALHVPRTAPKLRRLRRRVPAVLCSLALAAPLLALPAGPARSGSDATAPRVAGAAGHAPAGPSCQAVPPERTATAARVVLEGLAARAGTAAPGDGSGTVSLNGRGYNYGPGRVAAAPERAPSGR